MYLRFCGINGPVCSAFKDEKGERERENPSAFAARARKKTKRLRKMSAPITQKLGGKVGENSKNWSLIVSSLCVYARAQNQHKRGKKFVTTNRSSLKNARVPFNLPHSGRLCGVPCFLNRTKIIMCLKESV